MASTSTTKRRRTTSTRPDAIEVLKRDHRDVEQLFKTFEGLGSGAHKRRRSVVDKMIAALSRHAAIEELIFYPRIRVDVPATEDVVLESLEEHHIVKWTLSELEDLPAEDERFTAKVTVLMESVRHHVKEEEQELFPTVRKGLGRSALADLGDELAAASKTAPTHPHPRLPDTPPGNVVADALVAPLDATANLASSAAKRVRKVIG
jgi:hemerythrin-like domain-containing protein